MQAPGLLSQNNCLTLVKFDAASSLISGYAWMEAKVLDDLQIIGTVLEDQDYLEKITKLQGYLDEVKLLLISFYLEMKP